MFGVRCSDCQWRCHFDIRSGPSIFHLRSHGGRGAIGQWRRHPTISHIGKWRCRGYPHRVSAAELSLAPVSSAAVACEWVRRYYAYESLPFNATVEQAVARLLESSQFGWFFALTHKEEAIGYAVLTRAFDHEFGGEIGILTDFFILEPYRRQGHGSRAMELIEDFARSQGFRSLDLYVLERNAGVREFYSRRGFREFADRRPMTKSFSN
jgi:GNAT superfamily N-acetyltransferase